MFSKEGESFMVPRNCSEDGRLTLFDRLAALNPWKLNYEERLRIWKIKEEAADERFEEIIANMKFSFILRDALLDLNNRVLVTVYSNRLIGNNEENSFCVGGRLEADMSRRGRNVRLAFLGIVIRTDYNFRKSVSVSDVENQVIYAEEKLRELKSDVDKGLFMSQSEVDRALYWFWNDELLEEKQK